jgi:uncharacterized protein
MSSPRPPFALPIKLDAVSNGEFVPEPLDPAVARVQQVACARIDINAKRRGVGRREFLRSTCAAATVLLTMNELLGCDQGRYAVHPTAGVDEAAADATLAGEEFIFDVQTHHVSTTRPWYEKNAVMQFLASTPQGKCGEDHWSECYSRDLFIKEVFLDSDTDLGVLSALAGGEDANPLHEEEMAQTREAVARLQGSPRLRIHGIVLPNLGSMAQTRERMHKVLEDWSIAAWKLYTLWGPDGTGYFLDDEIGMATIEHAIALGLPLIAVHKGLPLRGMDPKYTRPRDVGPAARAYPEATFLVYHAGYEASQKEGPYDPKSERGIDALITSLRDNGIDGSGNVYAELGSTWREIMRDPQAAAHVIGKLLKYLGEDRILWGTDAIWYGSPQDQIQAFRAFEISPEMQERHGYPALTPERKAKIFGLNGARVYGLSRQEVQKAIDVDSVSRAKQAYLSDPRPSFCTYGPRTVDELDALTRSRGGLPS